MSFDFLKDWGPSAQKQERHYITRWETGYSFTEPATGTVCWFCEREGWQHDLILPRKSLLSQIVRVWPYRLKDIMFLTTGREKEIKVVFVHICQFKDIEELDDDYICFNDVEVGEVHALDAFERIGQIRDMLQDRSFIKHFPILVENLNNAFKKIKKTKAHK